MVVVTTVVMVAMVMVVVVMVMVVVHYGAQMTTSSIATPADHLATQIHFNSASIFDDPLPNCPLLLWVYTPNTRNKAYALLNNQRSHDSHMTHPSSSVAPPAPVHSHAHAVVARLDGGRVGYLKTLIVVGEHPARLSRHVPWTRGGAILGSVDHLTCIHSHLQEAVSHGAL
jgi:hypothetical protein